MNQASFEDSYLKALEDASREYKKLLVKTERPRPEEIRPPETKEKLFVRMSALIPVEKFSMRAYETDEYGKHIHSTYYLAKIVGAEPLLDTPKVEKELCEAFWQSFLHQYSLVNKEKSKLYWRRIPEINVRPIYNFWNEDVDFLNFRSELREYLESEGENTSRLLDQYKKFIEEAWNSREEVAYKYALTMRYSISYVPEGYEKVGVGIYYKQEGKEGYVINDQNS